MFDPTLAQNMGERGAQRAFHCGQTADPSTPHSQRQRVLRSGWQFL